MSATGRKWVSDEERKRRWVPHPRIFDGTLASVFAYIDALPAEPNGCVLWDRGTANGRYGRANWRDESNTPRQAGPHRLVLERSLGRPLGVGMRALHRCDTPLCVNVLHLWEGTHAENMADMVRKGRGANRWTKLRNEVAA